MFQIAGKYGKGVAPIPSASFSRRNAAQLNSFVQLIVSSNETGGAEPTQWAMRGLQTIYAWNRAEPRNQIGGVYSRHLICGIRVVHN